MCHDRTILETRVWEPLGSSFHKVHDIQSSKRSHPQTKLEIVLRTARHDTVEGIDSVWHAEWCFEQTIDLVRVGEVCFDSNSFGAFRGFGFNDVGENKMTIWRLGVVQQSLCELTTKDKRQSAV